MTDKAVRGEARCVSGRPRRRLAPDARREELLQAAIDVFTELGYGPATLQDVATRAGVTKGALYHYFDSKESLFIELIRERMLTSIAAMTLEAASPGAPREDLLARFIGGIWRHFQQPGEMAVTRLVIAELPKFPELRQALFEQVSLPARARLREALAGRVACGELCPEATEAVVAVVPYMIMGVALGRHIFEGVDPHDVECGAACRVTGDVLLHGIRLACRPPASG